MRRVFASVASPTAAVPRRSVFFGKLDNTSLEVIFRNILRQDHVQKYLTHYFSRAMTTQTLPKSHGPVKVAPPACVSDPHRVLRLFACLAHPVISPDGKQEVWLPEGHRDRHHHSHGPIRDRWDHWLEREEHRREDGALHRGHAYEGEGDYKFPSEDNRAHAVFWCEHYKIRVVHAEPILFLAEELLKALGREPTPESADAAIDELFDGTSPEILTEWRATMQRVYDELCFFRPTATRQWLEQIQSFQPNTVMWGGLYGSYLKNRRMMDPRRDDVDLVDPQYIFINPPINNEALRQPAYSRMKFY